jgi:hypothetical protein
LTVLPGNKDIQDIHAQWKAAGCPEKQFYRTGSSYEPLISFVGKETDFGGGSPASSVRTMDGLSLGSSANPTRRLVQTETPVQPEVLDYNKSCSVHEAIQWVAANISRHPKDIRLSEVPSPTAWNLLVYVQAGPANEKDFWTNIWSKTIPSKQQFDAAMQRDIDNSKLEEVMDDILAAIRSDGEPPLVPVEFNSGA